MLTRCLEFPEWILVQELSLHDHKEETLLISTIDPYYGSWNYIPSKEAGEIRGLSRSSGLWLRADEFSLGHGVQGSGCRVWGPGFRAWGSGFRV